MTQIDPEMPNATIRPVRAADAFGLLQMVRALAAHHGDVAQLGLDRLMQDVIGPKRHFDVLVAEQGGALVGYAALQAIGRLQDGARGADLHHLYVAPDQRGQGVGRLLLDAAQQAATRQGATYLRVSAHVENVDAQGFYRATGWVERPVSEAVVFGRAL